MVYNNQHLFIKGKYFVFSLVCIRAYSNYSKNDVDEYKGEKGAVY